MLGVCQSKSPIYARNSHNLCIFGLFKKRRRNYQVEVMTGEILPQVVSLSDEIRPVALMKKMELSRVCEGDLTSKIKIELPLATISLPMKCSTFGESLEMHLVGFAAIISFYFLQILHDLSYAGCSSP